MGMYYQIALSVRVTLSVSLYKEYGNRAALIEEVVTGSVRGLYF